MIIIMSVKYLVKRIVPIYKDGENAYFTFKSYAPGQRLVVNNLFEYKGIYNCIHLGAGGEFCPPVTN